MPTAVRTMAYYTYERVEKHWHAFNDVYLVIYPT